MMCQRPRNGDLGLGFFLAISPPRSANGLGSPCEDLGKHDEEEEAESRKGGTAIDSAPRFAQAIVRAKPIPQEQTRGYAGQAEGDQRPAWRPVAEQVSG